MNDLHIIVINLNNLRYTKDCISDLMRQQYMGYDLTVVDNASREADTREYMKLLGENGVNVIVLPQRKHLNRIWNDFYLTNKNKYLCYLNNDVRLSFNYTQSIMDVYTKEPEVGMVCHASNNAKYSEMKEIEYVVLFEKIRQGWDFTIRREAYALIPDNLEVFCGDDYLYAKLYEKKWKSAMILSSPLIHFLGMSQDESSGAQYNKDMEQFTKLGIPTFEWSGYSKGKPYELPYGCVKDKLEPLLTINIVTFERYQDMKKILEMFQAQTDPRFVLDVWQDGCDDKKRKIVEEFPKMRIKYSENKNRANRYGHDMRNSSIMNCTTKYWCTTNDDNWINPLFVERVLKALENSDMMRFSVAMANLPNPNQVGMETESFIREGVFDAGKYVPCMKVLSPDGDIEGQVDACAFVVKTAILKKIGWKNVEFHADFLVYGKLLKMGLSINRIHEVLQVHR